MRQVGKVLVSGKELQAVFNYERGNPDIVGGNGRTLLTQLAKELGIVPRCGLAGIESGHPRPIEKAQIGMAANIALPLSHRLFAEGVVVQVVAGVGVNGGFGALLPA